MSTNNEIFFSYAWGDENEKGESREKIVNDLYQSLLKDGYNVKRDKDDLQYKGLITDFMVKIGQGKHIVVAVSEKYCKSPYCMFELYEIARNSNFNKKQFIERVIPIMVEFIDFSKPKIIFDYLSFWEKEYKEWLSLVKKKVNQLSVEKLQRFDKVKMIYQNFDKLSEWLIDMNSLNPKMLSKDNFNEIKKAIKEETGLIQTQIKEEIPEVNSMDTRKNFSTKKTETKILSNESNKWVSITVKEIAKTSKSKTLEFTLEKQEAYQIDINSNLIEDLLDSHEKNKWIPEIGKTLFELIIPPKIKNFFQQENNIIWRVDKDTIKYPWELLVVSDKVLALNIKTIRSLSVSSLEMNIKRTTENKALIVADPDNNDIHELPGAIQEGTSLNNLLIANGFETNTQFHTKTNSIVMSFFSDNYKVMHFAGYGFNNDGQSLASGILIGKDVYLTASEFRQLSVIPELVFLNCPFSGKTDIANTLIESGVKSVVVCVGMTDDYAAAEFSNVFYENLFAGNNFSESILHARREVFKNYADATWCLYQGYGDPFYTIS